MRKLWIYIVSFSIFEQRTSKNQIDPPVDDISIKRLRFYSNLGFVVHDFNHIHPPYRTEYKGHKLKIMSYNKTLTNDEYDYFNSFLKEIIMKYVN